LDEEGGNLIVVRLGKTNPVRVPTEMLSVDGNMDIRPLMVRSCGRITSPWNCSYIRILPLNVWHAEIASTSACVDNLVNLNPEDPFSKFDGTQGDEESMPFPGAF